MSSRWRARVFVASIYLAFIAFYYVLSVRGVGFDSIQTAVIGAAVFLLIEHSRQGSLLPWWSVGAHLFTAGFTYLLRGPEGPQESVFGLGLCALSVPFLINIYRNRHKKSERDAAKFEAEMAELEKRLDEEERKEREAGGP